MMVVATFFQVLSGQDIPFMQMPDWESSTGGRSTGLGLADINGDGWKDIVVANGNDMARQHLVVYYNQGDGTFPVDPDWESDDIDYHGHLAVGDVNDDGWIDVAVSVYIGESGFSDPGKVKIYYNLGGELEGTPSFQSVAFYNFSCALGDIDGDGDLDLATTGGEPYSGIYDFGKVFINNNGAFDTIPGWISSFPFGSLDVDFGDMDRNGYLDLVFTSEETPNYIFLANDSGGIQDTASWKSTDPANFINSLDIGLVGSAKIPAIVATGNDQLGGNGEVWEYRYPEGVADSGNADWSSYPFGYGSGILLADINLDELPDLVYGGWWLPVNIALGFSEGDFETVPSYTSSTGSVVEAIQMADLDRDDIHTATETFFTTELLGPVIYLEKQLVENILSVKINGEELDDSLYCYVPNKNWISIQHPFLTEDTISVEYEYSNDCDMVVSNWDSNRGNYIFYNTMVTGTPEVYDHSREQLQAGISPNPFQNDINIRIICKEAGEIAIQLSDITGKVLFNKTLYADAGESVNCVIPGSKLEKGLYLVTLKNKSQFLSKKVIKF